MKMLEMYAGLEGGSSGFRARGWDVVTTDFDPKFNCTITGDVLDPTTLDALIAAGPYDFVWASPPCEAFTVMNIGKNWTPDHMPRYEIDPEKWAKIPLDKRDRALVVQKQRGDAATLGLRILLRTIEILNILQPRLGYIIENPRGKMRKMPQMEQFDRATVWYCRYGLHTAKPTDLWTPPGFRDFWTPRPECNNGNPDHESAPRGSKTGIQGIETPEERALVPIQLSEEVCLAAEARDAFLKRKVSFRG